MVDLWGRPWTRRELLARVGRLEQVAGMQLVEAGDGAERDIDAFADRATLLAGNAGKQPAEA